MHLLLALDVVLDLGQNGAGQVFARGGVGAGLEHLLDGLLGVCSGLCVLEGFALNEAELQVPHAGSDTVLMCVCSGAHAPRARYYPESELLRQH